MSKPRQLRGRVTGGIGDVEAFYEVLKDYAKDNDWTLTFEEGPAKFGNHGPINKITFGFTTKP